MKMYIRLRSVLSNEPPRICPRNCVMKFCDPEEFDYAVYNTQFDDAGVRHLFIEIDQEAVSFEQARTRIQSFSEML